MKILSWNMNRDMGCSNLMGIISSLQEHQSEVIFIHDFLNDRNGQIIRNTMRELGWENQYFTGIGSISGILLLSVKPFQLSRCNYRKPSKSYGWLDILFDEYRLTVLAVNIPAADNAVEYWERLLEYSRIKSVDDCLIIGTLGSEEKNDLLPSLRPIDEILQMGWIDLIGNAKQANITNEKPEFRVDYMFASRMLRTVVLSAYISNAEKEIGFSRLPVILEFK